MSEVFQHDVAGVYDLLYRARGKDYQAECDTVIDIVRSRNPSAQSLLDVGCGTGVHLAHFAADFGHVEGIDLSEDMLALAAARLPAVPLHRGDIADFTVDRTFDVVTSLFTVVGYLSTVEQLNSALRCMARALAPGGVLLVEPWWFPETFLPGFVSKNLVEIDGYTIARVSHSRLEGDFSVVDMHYLVADERGGVRHFDETHRLRLYTQEQYEEAFRLAGLKFEIEAPEGGHTGHPYFVGVRA
ncbi:class I SAM-dependent DNA methyltransferase [Amycolatopsis sp. CA-230715]|uniref:class I SAM-dependent DNA methyltransferase n=1 Tax=Amycolatopsis sp. CA-230715 TaxID=2745196 RepID=UPI001C021BB5|nr:class I SAM-dependent methyltransferase [Amycolatopsis sp. CA-230715]